MMSFNNIQPRTREQRASLKNKEKIEDKFIRERTGDYLHQSEHFKMLATDQKSTHYITGIIIVRNRQVRSRLFNRAKKRKGQQNGKARKAN